MPADKKLRLPVPTSIQLDSFTLYSLRPNLQIEFGDGVFCLAGANGLGKSTFLTALAYGITGIVAPPGRKFESTEEYYEESDDSAKSYFDGRIGEDDRDEA